MAKCSECAWWDKETKQYGRCLFPLPDWAEGFSTTRAIDGTDCPQFKEREDGER